MAIRNSKHSRDKKTQITVKIDKEVFDKFTRIMKQLRLRRDAYLNQHLVYEADFLSQIRPSSERAARFLASLRRLRSGDVKVNITLDKDIAQTITDSCKKKCISRDTFIERYMAFLAGAGDFEGNASPLELALDILNDPREATIILNCDDNLYADLSCSDEDVEASIKALVEKNKER